ncbi:sugar ABC transporter substrate-binding protein [Lentzea sp. PSKA42]|uniref:Sugar ABC transporter substrate-binding protein n=1 Tax=Lentzea indica TaxID=2604800 RepID=A0ABX1FSZ0_9PSEU|nr:sugar ABC transporter substrate-binding protein [Lentzea indica]
MGQRRPFRAMSAVVACLVASACSSSTSTPTPEPEVTVAVWGSEQDAKTYQQRVELAGDRVNGVNVKLLHVPNNGDYGTKIQSMISEGNPPDIIQVAESVHSYSSKNQLLPLNNFIETEKLDLVGRFGERAAHSYDREGKTWALPDRNGPMVLYYNKDLFDKDGVPYPTADWKWPDFLAAAQKLTVKDGDKTMRYGFAAGDWWPWWMAFMLQNGGRILDDAGKPVINSPENAKAMQFYADLVHKHHVAPSKKDYEALKISSPDQLFAQGNAAMIMTGFWNIAALKETPQVRWGISPLFKNTKQATISFQSGLAITKSSRRPELAFKVLDFLTSAEGQKPIATTGQDAPANREVQDSEEFLRPAWAIGDVSMDAFKQSAEFAFAPPMTPEWGSMQKAFGTIIGEICDGVVTPKDGLAAAQRSLENLGK